MRTGTRRVTFGAMCATMAALLAAAAYGQAPASPATLEDVVREIRALRTDLQASSQASLRLQAIVARVTFQEQRLKALSEQLNQASAELSAATEKRRAHAEGVKRFEEAMSSGSRTDAPREELEQATAVARRALADAQAKESALLNRVTELSGLVTTEQERWVDLNARLEALEQSLQLPR